MRKITKYEANDGALFNTEEEALNHERLAKIQYWYDDNKIYGTRPGSRIEWGEFYEWINDNKEKLKEILEVL